MIRTHAHIGFWGSLIGFVVSMDRGSPTLAWIFGVAAGVYWGALAVADRGLRRRLLGGPRSSRQPRGED